MLFKITITKKFPGDANNLSFLSFLTIFWTIFDLFSLSVIPYNPKVGQLVTIFENLTNVCTKETFSVD